MVILGAACVHAAINCPSLDGKGAHKQLMGGASAEKPADEDVNQLLKDTTKWQDEVLKQARPHHHHNHHNPTPTPTHYVDIPAIFTSLVDNADYHKEVANHHGCQ